MGSLALLSRELDRNLERAPLNKKRAAILAACELAVTKADLKHSTINKSLLSLRSGHAPAADLKSELDTIAKKFDDEYFELKGPSDDGNPEEYRPAFMKARAAAALSFLAGDEGFRGAGDAIYEAASVFDDSERDEFISAVEAALG
jgi:hypothetical protein